MTRYTRDDSRLIFNPARQKAFLSLRETLAETYGLPGISEKGFRDLWLLKMGDDGTTIADGWYCPPPRGTAVLFGERITFDSLRNEYNWSGDTMIDWHSDLLYAYASPVDRTSGRIGDTSVTLYFGPNTAVSDHIRRCHDAVMDVFESLGKAQTAGALFDLSREIFLRHRLRDCVISRTDSAPSNLSHTFPKLESVPADGILSEEDIRMISTSRRFINTNADWEFTDGLQFTVEPQLMSYDDESLPQITQHYVVRYEAGVFTVCNDIDIILADYDQI